MRLLPLVLCLLTFLPQTNSDQTVALVFRDRIEIVKLSEAQTEFQRLSAVKTLTESEQSRLVALVIALETVPEPQFLPRNTDTQAFLANEIRRGVRKPLQGRN